MPQAVHFLPILDGLDRLLDALDRLGPTGIAIPAEDVRLTLQGGRTRGMSFEQAWNIAVNRLQAPNTAGVALDEARQESLQEARVLIEEDRGVFLAAFEGRRLDVLSQARHVAREWDRLEGRPAAPARARRARRGSLRATL